VCFSNAGLLRKRLQFIGDALIMQERSQICLLKAAIFVWFWAGDCMQSSDISSEGIFQTTAILFLPAFSETANGVRISSPAP